VTFQTCEAVLLTGKVWWVCNCCLVLLLLLLLCKARMYKMHFCSSHSHCKDSCNPICVCTMTEVLF
jgi:hypothetical protein